MPQEIRVALVLGSGGVRGMAHVGVLEERAKKGVSSDKDSTEFQNFIKELGFLIPQHLARK